MKDFLNRIMSRKFLLVVLGVLYFGLNGNVDELRNIIIAYLGIEGAADTVDRYKNGTTTIIDSESTVSQNNGDEQVDTTKVITGATPLFDEEPKEK